MSSIVKDDGFELMAEFVRPDAKKRITLGLATASKAVYQVYQNRLGQIMLDPVKPVPAYECWLYENPAALAAVRQGLKESAEGKRVYRGSFQDAEE
jgi:hypothetical protein